ncbi:MAG: YggS family pyridoxal phosphate-dependent enzyme, partial [Pseudomonadota bacterium]
MKSDIEARLNETRENLTKAAADAGRSIDNVTLIAVSKTFDADAIRPALEAGQRVFGENRVQESQGKWPGLMVDYPDTQLHLIGPLQS